MTMPSGSMVTSASKKPRPARFNVRSVSAAIESALVISAISTALAAGKLGEP